MIELLFFRVIKDQALAGALSGAMCHADCSPGIAHKNQAGARVSHLSRRCSPQPPAGKPFSELLGWAAQRKHGTPFSLFLKDMQKNHKRHVCEATAVTSMHAQAHGRKQEALLTSPETSRQSKSLFRKADLHMFVFVIDTGSNLTQIQNFQEGEAFP